MQLSDNSPGEVSPRSRDCSPRPIVKPKKSPDKQTRFCDMRYSNIVIEFIKLNNKIIIKTKASRTSFSWLHNSKYEQKTNGGHDEI